MRYMNVHLLLPGGKTEWRIVPWGKHSLDNLRREGFVVIGYHEL
jgi:hypothetical protein